MSQDAQSDAFRCIVHDADGLVIARVTSSDDWYAYGWDAARVAAVAADTAEQRRVEQIVNGGAGPLDEERVRLIEATSAFFSLLARLHERAYVSVEEVSDEMTDAIARLSRSANGVIAESIWLE
ncbi:hypothetical protein K0817_009350 [Microbacterium sp. HD4P20]|uniref:hypothetical protein n=1 Tax=Microbacterium sp. HD4P20 TaxID=2864874 RepID=UPI001C64098A|nr:hypothetical protein [Microbacterium sp. HD4P20]MCP2636769.1 hypothetical protein [Microbacterium sp. HD4P20]